MLTGFHMIANGWPTEDSEPIGFSVLWQAPVLAFFALITGWRMLLIPALIVGGALFSLWTILRQREVS